MRTHRSATDDERASHAMHHLIPDLATLAPRPITQCKCHGRAWAIRCPDCGCGAYAYSNRPGRNRSGADGPSGWACVCGARDALPMALAAA